MEELISRLFLGENWFRLLFQIRTRTESAVGYFFSFLLQQLFFCPTHLRCSRCWAFFIDFWPPPLQWASQCISIVLCVILLVWYLYHIAVLWLSCTSRCHIQMHFPTSSWWSRRTRLQYSMIMLEEGNVPRRPNELKDNRTFFWLVANVKTVGPKAFPEAAYKSKYQYQRWSCWADGDLLSDQMREFPLSLWPFVAAMWLRTFEAGALTFLQRALRDAWSLHASAGDDKGLHLLVHICWFIWQNTWWRLWWCTWWFVWWNT